MMTTFWLAKLVLGLVLATSVVLAQDPVTCADNPCRNGGNCKDTDTGYICGCIVQYKGDNCEIPRTAEEITIERAARVKAAEEAKAERRRLAAEAKAERRRLALEAQAAKEKAREEAILRQQQERQERAERFLAEKLAAQEEAARQKEETRQEIIDRLEAEKAARAAEAERQRRLDEQKRALAEELKALKLEVARKAQEDKEERQRLALEEKERQKAAYRAALERKREANRLAELWKKQDAEQRRWTEGKIQHYKGTSTCTTYDGHYLDTFDGERIAFNGAGCEFLLSKTVSDYNACAYEVTMLTQLEHNGAISVIKTVYIRTYGFEFALQRGGLLKVNGVRKYTPVFMSNRFAIVRNTQSITFRSDCGLQVILWDDLAVQIISNFSIGITGLCGDNNADLTNDFVTLEGDDVRQEVNRDRLMAQSYGILLYSRTDIPEYCKDPNWLPEGVSCTDPLLKSQAEAHCAFIKDENGPFGVCGQVKPSFIERAFSYCVLWHCSQGPPLVNIGVCPILARLAEECWQTGVFVEDWRDDIPLCSLKCPANSHYAERMPANAPTCWKRYHMKNSHYYDTQSGCECDEGTVLGDEGCVPLNQCGCIFHQTTYVPADGVTLSIDCTRRLECAWNAGTSEHILTVTRQVGCGHGATCLLWEGIRQCRCDDGFFRDGLFCYAVELTPEQLEAKKRRREQHVMQRNNNFCECRAAGDPHYVTYDKQKLHFQGACTYTFSKSTEANETCSFHIKVKNNRRHEDDKVSFTKAVYIEAGDTDIFLLPYGKVMVDGMIRYPPVLKPEYTIQRSGLAVEVTTQCGLEVSFDGQHRVVVRVPKDQGGKLEGLCADCNQDKSNDLTTSEGVNVLQDKNRFNLFGNSWLTDNPETSSTRVSSGTSSDQDCEETYIDIPCKDEIMAQIRSDAYCGRLISQDGPFKDCIHDTGATAQNTYESCLMDVCSYWSEEETVKEVLCMAYQELSGVCEALSKTIIWRTTEFCPLDCPENSQYNPLMSGCQPTCLIPKVNEDDCPMAEREGCQCKPGYLLDNDKCIREEDCGCKDANNDYVPRNEKFVSPDCANLLECVSTDLGSMLDVTSLNLPPCHYDAECYSEDVDNPVCKCKDGYFGDGYTTCYPEGPPDIIDPFGCVCVVSGDPHITTPDQAVFKLNDHCMYVLMESDGPPEKPQCAFRVEAKNERRPTSHRPHQAYIRLLDIKAKGMVIRLHKDGQIFLNGLEVNAQVRPIEMGGLYIEHYGMWMNVTYTECAYSVHFDGNSVGIVNTDKQYREIVQGLCGNCNGDAIDDVGEHHGALAQLTARSLTQDVSDVPSTSAKCVPE